MKTVYYEFTTRSIWRTYKTYCFLTMQELETFFDKAIKPYTEGCDPAVSVVGYISERSCRREIALTEVELKELLT